MHHARDLVVNHLGCDIWDVRKFVSYPKNSRQFLRWNLHISLYRLFIDFIQYILSPEWSWNFYSSSVYSCPQLVAEWPYIWTSRTEAVVYVVRKRSQWFRVILEYSWTTKSGSDRFALCTEIKKIFLKAMWSRLIWPWGKLSHLHMMWLWSYFVLFETSVFCVSLVFSNSICFLSRLFRQAKCNLRPTNWNLWL